MKTQTLLASMLGVALVTALTIACAKTSSAGLNLPLVTPPVKAATPAGFQDSRRGVHSSRTLDTAEFKSRFFSNGPTNIFSILTTIDDRITELNTRSLTSTSTCLTATPVEYTVTAWGNAITMYAQCYEVLSGATTADPKLIQWGTKDTKVYLYMAVGAQRVAAIVTPSVTAVGEYKVEAYVGVGYTNSECDGRNSWDGCSYGVMQLSADSATSAFEMTVAGMGFGFCGAHIRSDGTNVYGAGSADMASSCGSTDTVCVLGSDLVTAGDCTSINTFDLDSLGRQGNSTTGVAQPNWAESQFPASPTVTLDGTSTDDLNFGPTTPTTGVIAF